MKISRHLAGGLLLKCLSLSSLNVAASLENIEWIGCPVDSQGLRCGMLTVPEDWSKPDSGGTARVHFLHFKADSQKPKADPVAFLTGGPGVSVYFGFRSLERLSTRRQRDLIVMEPRGYGYSEPWLGCENVGQLAECYAEAVAGGIDVTQYNTENSVRDYEALRHALGYANWNLIGVSYGGYWASLYARMYPESIRSLVLDSPYPLNAGYDWNRASALNALDRVFTACQADYQCAQAYPNLRQRFIDAMIRLINQPDQWQGKTIGPHAAFDPIYHAVYMSTLLRNTPLLVDALARQDYDMLFEVGAQLPFEIPQAVDLSRLSSLGLNASVLCREDIFFPADPVTRVPMHGVWPEALVQAIHPEGWDYDTRCGSLHVPLAAKTLNEPLFTALPSLVLVGAYDPITPTQFAEAMLLGMEKGTLAVDSSAAHIMVLDEQNACVAAILNTFIEAPLSHPDLSCLAKVSPVKWKLPQ